MANILSRAVLVIGVAPQRYSLWANAYENEKFVLSNKEKDWIW